MVHVIFHRDSRNRLSSIFARGHAGYAIEADDLVCAAVSAILQAARLGLEAHAGVALAAEQQSGDFSIRWPARDRSDAGVRAIVATAELAVRQLARQYPEYVRCTNRREPGAGRNKSRKPG